MARGFSSGVLWGGVIGLGLTTATSILAPLPSAPVVSDASPEVGAAPARVEQASSGESGSQSDRTLITGQVAPQTTQPETDTAPVLDPDALTPAAQPQTGDVAALDAPALAADSGTVAVDADAPVLPNPQALAPMAPQPADDLAISTEPAAPPAPSTEKVEGDFAAPAQPQTLGAPQEDRVDVAVAADGVTAVAPQPQALPAPAAGGDTQTLADSTVPAPPTEAAQIAAITEELQVKPLDPPVTVVTQVPVDRPAEEDVTAPTVPEADQLPAEVDESERAQVAESVPSDDAQTDVAEAEDEGSETAAAETVTDEAAEVETAEAETTKSETEQTQPAQSDTAQSETVTDSDTQTAQSDQNTTTEEEPQAQTGAASSAVVVRRIGTQATTLTDRNTGVTINRPTNVDAEPEAPEAPAEAAPDNSDLPPVKRFVQDFENPEQKPLMSIVLIDDGTSDVAGAEGIAALAGFPYTLSFAVDSSLTDAADRMAIYRAAGFEVLAMIDLPEGAQPSDAETTLGVILPKMDEVVGVLEGTNGGLQGARPVADQVTAILAQTGHGLVTQDKGLNTMPKLARKAGVPADPVFRDFDSKGQSAQVIRRFLDQAAFKAGQEGAVVMLGRLRPDTIAALSLWGLQDRAGKVALAPISALLTRDPS